MNLYNILKTIKTSCVIYNGDNITIPFVVNRGDRLTDILEKIFTALETGGSGDTYTIEEVDELFNEVYTNLGSSLTSFVSTGAPVDVVHGQGSEFMMFQVTTQTLPKDIITDAVMVILDANTVRVTVPAGNYYLKGNK